MASKKQNNLKKWVLIIVIAILALFLFVGCEDISLLSGQGGSGGINLGEGINCDYESNGETNECEAVWFTNHWECNGTCEGWDTNCVLNPTNEIPEGGFINPQIKPYCVCLEKTPGNCGWYDASFGYGEDNIQCEGVCQTGESCESWVQNGINFCACKDDVEEDQPIFKCSDIISAMGQLDCNVGVCQ